MGHRTVYTSLSINLFALAEDKGLRKQLYIYIYIYHVRMCINVYIDI